MFQLRLNGIQPINCADRKHPRYRVFSLFTDSFLLSKHEAAVTNKELFGGLFVSTKMLARGRDKFFKLLLGPVIDSSMSEQALQTILDTDEEESSFLSLRENGFDRIPFSTIKTLKLRSNFLSEFKAIDISYGQEGSLQTLTFSICAFTPWGVKDLPDQTKSIFKTLKRSTPNLS